MAELPSLEPGVEWRGEISTSGHRGGKVALEDGKSQARGQKSTRQVWATISPVWLEHSACMWWGVREACWKDRLGGSRGATGPCWRPGWRLWPLCCRQLEEYGEILVLVCSYAGHSLAWLYAHPLLLLVLPRPLRAAQPLHRKAWRAAQPVVDVVGRMVSGRLPASTSVAPVTARSWGLHWALDPDLDSEEKDMNKVLLGPLLRAYHDPGLQAFWDLLTAGVWRGWELEATRRGRAGPAAAAGLPSLAHCAPGAGVLPRLTRPGEAAQPRKPPPPPGTASEAERSFSKPLEMKTKCQSIMLGERPMYLSYILSIENDVKKINVLRWSEQRVCEKT